ncbi:hypothetical protein [Azorhizophilus paspali]|uniref:Uncharacterized protein n=1 Tax=Azorhizophilus paspali TaxID=69963 RepID=A0ABV6SG27_AZOPA
MANQDIRSLLSKQTYELSREVEQLEAQAVATLKGRAALDEYNDAKAVAIALAEKHVDAQSAEGKALEEAIRKSREATRVLGQAGQVEGIMDRLFPETKRLREYTREQEALNKAIELYPERADEYREALRRLGIEYKQSQIEATAWGQWTKSALERVDNAFADMWKGIDGDFDSFANDLKNSLFQLLAKLSHMATTHQLVVQMGSVLGIGGLAGQSTSILGPSGGGSGGAGTGLLGSLNKAYSLYQAGTGEGLLGSVIGGFRKGGLSGAWEGLSDYGSGLYKAVASLFGGSASSAVSNVGFHYGGSLISGGIGNASYASSSLGSLGASWSGPLSGAFAGYQAGGLGGAVVGGLSTWGGAAAGTAIGQAIGGALGSLGGPVGTVIGTAVGSWLASSLFGGSGERFKETYTTNTGYYSDGKFVDTGKIGWSTGHRQFGDSYDTYLESVNKRFSSTLGALSEVFGTGDTVYTHLSAQLRRTSGAIAGDLWTNLGGAVAEQQFHRTARYGQDGENVSDNLKAFANDVLGQWLAEAISKSKALPEYLRGQFEDLAADAQTTAEQVQTRISEIVGRFEGLNSMLELVGFSALKASDAGLQAGDAIIELAGGLEALQNAVNVYYEQFYSEAERAADTLKKVPAMFANLGIELPTVRDEYRAMVEDIDVTTAAGQRMFATMMSLAGNADAYYDILESQAAAAEQAAAAAAATLLQAELNYYDLFTDEAQKTEDTLASVQAQFAALNVVLPSARDGFVQAIEALDLTGESGQAMYETLLGLATSADSYYDILEARAAEAQAAAEQAAAEQAALQEAIADQQTSLLAQLRDAQIELAEATGDSATAEALRAGILQEERNALYESNRAIYDQIQSTHALATAAAEQAALQEAIAGQQTSLLAQLRDAQIELAEATGDSATAEALRAGILQEERNALYESNRAIYDQIQSTHALATAAAEQAALQEAIAGQQTGLLAQLRDAQIELAEATGDSATAEALRAGILQEERNALYESNRAIYDQIQSTHALATAAAEQAALQEAIAGQQTSLLAQLRDAQIELAEATGDSATAEALRAGILQEERDALYESNRAIYDQIQSTHALTAAAIADAEARAAAEEAVRARTAGAATAAIAAAQGSLSSLSSVLDAQKSLVAEQYQAQADAIQAAMAEARDSIGEMGAVVGTLRGTLGRLRLESDALDAVGRRQAQGVIQQALASVRGGQRVTLSDDLKRALDQVSQPSSQLFSSFEDYQRDYWQTYFSIERLAETAETQLDADERAAAMLERQLESTKAYYKAEIERLDMVLEGAQAQLNALLGINTSVQSVEAALAVFAGSVQSAQALQNANASITSITGLAGVRRQVDSQGYILDEYGNAITLLGEALRVVGDHVVGGNGALFNIVDGRMTWAAGQTANMQEWARQQGIPGFASGGQFEGGVRLVGEDGPELEVTGPSRIYSAVDTVDLLRGRADSEAIARLEPAIVSLQEGIRSIAKYTMQTARRVEFLERWDYDGLPTERA